MLLRNIILLMEIVLQGSEDIPCLDNVLTTLPFDVEKCWVSNAVLIGQCSTVLWGNDEVLKFLPENMMAWLFKRGSGMPRCQSLMASH